VQLVDGPGAIAKVLKMRETNAHSINIALLHKSDRSVLVSNVRLEQTYGNAAHSG
jgi:hypothetical protein